MNSPKVPKVGWGHSLPLPLSFHFPSDVTLWLQGFHMDQVVSLHLKMLLKAWCEQLVLCSLGSDEQLSRSTPLVSLGLAVSSRQELIYQVYEAVKKSLSGEDGNPIPWFSSNSSTQKRWPQGRALSWREEEQLGRHNCTIIYLLFIPPTALTHRWVQPARCTNTKAAGATQASPVKVEEIAVGSQSEAGFQELWHALDLKTLARSRCTHWTTCTTDWLSQGLSRDIFPDCRRGW